MQSSNKWADPYYCLAMCILIIVYFNNSIPPLAVRIHCKTPTGMPEVTDSIEPYLYYAFPTHIYLWYSLI